MRGIPADSDQDMFTKLKAGGGEQYDIVFANAGFCPFYHKAGLIEPIDLNRDSGGEESLADLQDEYRLSLHPRGEQDAAISEHVGVFRHMLEHRPFKVPPPYSWKSLWDAPKGKVILQGAGDDFICARRPRSGRAPGRDLLDDRADAARRPPTICAQLKPFQISNSSDVVTADAIRTGKAVVGQATSLGLAYRINEKAGKHVAEIQLPKEGALGWVDGPQLVKGAKNRDNALKFIDFLMGDPDMQDWLWQYNVFGMASQTTSERIMQSGEKLNAPVYDALGGMKPELATTMVFQGPSNIRRNGRRRTTRCWQISASDIVTGETLRWLLRVPGC